MSPEQPMYYCKACDYGTDRRSSFSKHQETMKHQKKMKPCSVRRAPELLENCCKWCGRTYVNRSGLWKHQPKCSLRVIEPETQEDTDAQEATSDKDADVDAANSVVTQSMVVQMLKYFQENERKHIQERQLMEMRLDAEREQCKKLMSTVQDMIPRLGSYNNNNININVFLQEQCKDALNLKDFVASLQIELGDIIRCKELSAIDAVGNVFVNGLRQLDLYKRPIHCTDLTRETLYIKENDAWEHEEHGRGMLHGAISAVAAKQSKAIHDWERRHPNWNDNEVLTAEYLRLVKTATSPIEMGSTDENKIIHTIAKEVVVDLSNTEGK
jgi:hypothetical protein